MSLTNNSCLPRHLQIALRLCAFGQMYKVLGMDLRPGRFRKPESPESQEDAGKELLVGAASHFSGGVEGLPVAAKLYNSSLYKPLCASSFTFRLFYGELIELCSSL